MNRAIRIERSRLTATAESLGAMAAESNCFTDKAVLLTGEPEILATENGRDCFLNSFRLLLRMVTNLTVRVPRPGSFADALSEESRRIAFGVEPRIQIGGSIRADSFDAVLSVGATAAAESLCTTINSNGWVARLSSRGDALSPECSQTNPIGALAAACLGVAEVFKRLIVLRSERGELSTARSFSLYSYCESEDPGPVLPSVIPVDFIMFGAGAIGNGIVHLLQRLPVCGQVAIVDRQVFQPENWGTCFRIGPAQFNVPKAEWAASVLRAKLNAGWFHGTVQDYREKCGKDLPFPRLIVNGLDNIPARRAVQEFWPDQIIDGAIGPTSCEVTLHPWPGNCSCLLCDFQEPSLPAAEIQAQATGLRMDRLTQPFGVVDVADVETAPLHLRSWLSARQGKQICSVVSEGVLNSISARSHKQGFEPSAPFVACLSSCMVGSELTRHCLGWPSVLQTGFQFDVLVGVQNGIFKVHDRKPDCICVTRQSNIERLRSKRENLTWV